VRAHAAVADAGENPIGDEAGLDAGGVRGAADRARVQRVRVRTAERVGVEAARGIVLVFVVVFVVFGGDPGRIEAREDAQEQGEDQGHQASGIRAQLRDRLSGGLQRGGMVRGMRHSQNIPRTNIGGKEKKRGRGRACHAGRGRTRESG
jgi:hypothetical protein